MAEKIVRKRSRKAQRAAKNARKREKKVKKRIAAGLCGHCGKKPCIKEQVVEAPTA